MTQPNQPTSLGTLLDGRYRLKALLGEGGMGRVYEAEDIRLSRNVAIKVMHEDRGDDTMAERLFREARAAARAEHPAVITSYGYGTDSDAGVNYLVMERLYGETLGQRIERVGPLPLPFVVHIGLEAADALAAVHGAGVVHRDLKPNNVFLATRGRRVDDVKLLDFGVAKQLDLHSLTTTGQVYGTPMYMAPEQLADSKHVDARCDLYSLGAVLFECVTGRAPFLSTNVMALVAEVLFGALPDVRALRNDVPDVLVAVIMRCMKREADERFVDARAVCDALGALG